jgi:tetratricopeptide (TPR) repeat protein
VSSHSLWLIYLAEACLLAQRVSDSLLHGRRALVLSREHNERGYEAWALRLLADVASRADPPDLEEAENKYGEAMALAERLEMLPLVARCQLELGDLYERAGDHARAATYHARGRRLFRDLEMRLPQDRDSA